MSDIFTPIYGQYESFLGRLFGPFASLNTYARLIHLAAMFPLGIGYFVVLVVAGATGGSLIWTFPGVLILILAMFLSRWAGDLEAFLVHNIAQVQFRRPPTRLEPGLTWREQLTTRLIDPSTWTGLVYLLVQFPVGIAMFVALTVIATVGGAFVSAPVVLAFDEDYAAEFWPALDTPLEGLVFVAPGLLCFLFLVHFTLFASGVHAAWARAMLGSRARLAGPAEDSTLPAPEPPPAALPAAEAEVAFAQMDAPKAAATPQPAAASPAFSTMQPSAEPLAAEPLTARERDVLGLIGRAYSNADIAETLVLSEGTVKTHVKRILAKLAVSNRTEAALYARDHGVVYVPADEAPVISLLQRVP